MISPEIPARAGQKPEPLTGKTVPGPAGSAQSGASALPFEVSFRALSPARPGDAPMPGSGGHLRRPFPPEWATAGADMSAGSEVPGEPQAQRPDGGGTIAASPLPSISPENAAPEGAAAPARTRQGGLEDMLPARAPRRSGPLGPHAEQPGPGLGRSAPPVVPGMVPAPAAVPVDRDVDAGRSRQLSGAPGPQAIPPARSLPGQEAEGATRHLNAGKPGADMTLRPGDAGKGPAATPAGSSPVPAPPMLTRTSGPEAAPADPTASAAPQKPELAQSRADPTSTGAGPLRPTAAPATDIGGAAIHRQAPGLSTQQEVGDGHRQSATAQMRPPPPASA